MTKLTTDIYFAAALLALGAKLEKVNRDDPRHMEFEFSSPTTFVVSGTPEYVKGSDGNDVPVHRAISETNLDNWETQWANGTLMVSASAYADAIRRMKTTVHSKS